MILPDCPHHVVQRGHNREAVFACEHDRYIYLASLRKWKTTLRVQVFAYCLMTNHVHLVVNPGEDPTRIARLMRELAGRHAYYLNRIEGGTGAVWDGRYKSSPIDTDEYLLCCSRYVELNPKRAGMCARPEDYPWSSYRAKVGLCECDWLDLDASYLSLGRTPPERQIAYREWVAAAIPEGEIQLLRSAIRSGRPTGSRRFAEDIERRLGRRLELRDRRPGE
jgi:REP-associated tyrosine transposase